MVGYARGMPSADVRSTFLIAAHHARDLVADSRVAGAWSAPSALDRMSVGALAGHLSRAVLTVRQYLTGAAPSDDMEVTSAAGYLGWLTRQSDLDSALHAGVRQRSEAAAADGPAAVVHAVDAALDHLGNGLKDEPAGRRVAVIGGMVMVLDEYLVTRLVELAVHSDDLAVSIGVESPPCPGIDLVIRLLVRVASDRHGQVAVLRALARRERDAAQALRVI
jgi:hypothetical protein